MNKKKETLGMPKESEKMIENNILRHLSLMNIYSWKVRSMGVFDPKMGKFRRSSPMYKKGVADILGVCADGRILAIEVKSKIGRLSPEQKLFLDEINARGGVSFVARSVSDVEAEFLRRGISDGNMASTKLRQASST